MIIRPYAKIFKCQICKYWNVEKMLIGKSNIIEVLRVYMLKF